MMTQLYHQIFKTSKKTIFLALLLILSLHTRTFTDATPQWILEDLPNAKGGTALRGHSAHHIPLQNPGAIPLITQLSGELGSVMSYIASGRANQIILKRTYGIDTDLKVRHQETMALKTNRTKENRIWVNSFNDIQICFPKLAVFDFSYANTPNFKEAYHMQEEWLNMERSLNNIERDSFEYMAIVAKMNAPQNLLRKSDYPVPFLYFNSRFPHKSIDSFYDDFKEMFELDSSCCDTKPLPDEIVFHLRDFCAERSNCLELGLNELSPRKVADELFAHLQPGDKVVISSRGENTQPYVDELEKRSLQVRVVTFQHGYQGFCFLMNAQKELVGFHKSLYFLWSAFLGSADRIRIYGVDSPIERKRGGDMNRPRFHKHEFFHPAFAGRVTYELYESEQIQETDFTYHQTGMLIKA